MATGFVFAGAAIVITIIGTITDLQNRWAPDYISYFGVLFGLSGHAILGLQQNSYWPFLLSLIGAGVFMGFGWLMSAFGAWGGGDAKMLVALGALMPYYQPIISNYHSAPWPFPVTLWLNILILGAVLGVVGTILIFARNFKIILPEIKNQFSKNKWLLRLSAGLIILSPAGLLANKYIALSVLLAGALGILFLALKSVETTCMHKDTKPEKLVEGDWLINEVKIGSVHIQPTKAGLETEDIKKIKELAAQGKITTVRVKEGLPYLPAFLAALLVSLFYGDLMLQFILRFLL